jgi:hypothetical protein
VGRTDAVLVEPAASEGAKRTRDQAGSLTAQDVNGLSVQVANESDTQGQVVASTGAVTTTLSTGESDAVAQQILSSFRAAAR